VYICLATRLKCLMKLSMFRGVASLLLFCLNIVDMYLISIISGTQVAIDM